MLLHLPILLIYFIASSYAQSNTINKACGIGDSTCGAGQACVNSRCECDPNQRRFWAGDNLQCRVCPVTYNRFPNRCYKYYSTPKNNSAARADCRRDQADLFSWRDNSDETELITASTAQWNSVVQSVVQQIYAWSGGIVHHGRGTKADYEITWFDPKGPTMHHPDMNDPYTDRYCNGMMMTDYKGDPEPTRQTKNGETEDCVSFVFLPQKNSRGQICMADDYCSTEMSYICELTEATISGIYQTVPPPDPVTNGPAEQPADVIAPTKDYYANQRGTQMPFAVAGNEGANSSNVMIYIIGLSLFFVVFGIVAFIIIRKRKQTTENMEMSPVNSMAGSNASDAEMYGNV